MRRGAGGGGEEEGLAGRGGDEEGLAGWGCVSVKCSSTTVGLTMPQHRARQQTTYCPRSCKELSKKQTILRSWESD